VRPTNGGRTPKFDHGAESGLSNHLRPGNFGHALILIWDFREAGTDTFIGAAASIRGVWHTERDHDDAATQPNPLDPLLSRDSTLRLTARSSIQI
jgi:hypothetical protein